MGLRRILKNRHRVLGLNERYLNYIRPHNGRKAIQIADDKVLTKKVLAEAEIPVPELIAEINNYSELEAFDFNSLPPSFVMKPKNGFEGGGIEIFYNFKNDYWIRGDKSKVSITEMRGLIEDILDGKYSIHKQPDGVMFEERIKPHHNFRYYTYKGTPDVRVIVFNNVPVMAMVRIPTERSQGKANLSLGAIGGAIDITEGRITTSIIGKEGYIEFVPGTSIRLAGLKIPSWDLILKYAIKAQRVTELGFAAVDFLIDRERGPLIVEINARAGLSIQLANKDGMHWRLKKVEGLKVKTIQKGIRVGKDLFGGEIAESIENISGKELIGILENVTLFGLKGNSEELKAKIDTGADSTSIDRKLLERLGYRTELANFDKFIEEQVTDEDSQLVRGVAGEFADVLTEKWLAIYPESKVQKIVPVFSSHGASFRPYLEIKMKLGDEVFTTLCSAYDRSKLKYSVIVGRKSLRNFIIDPSK